MGFKMPVPPPMRSLLRSLAVAALLSPVLPAAAAGEDDNPAYLETTGRYYDVIRVVEGVYARGAAPTASTLGPLCMAYSKVKRYGDLFECADKLEALVKAGDRNIKHVWSTVSDANATPLPEMLRAEALLELGEYEKAIDVGNRALKLVPEGGYDGSFWPPVKYRLSLLGTLAVASALAGRQTEAAELIKTLDDASIPFIGRSNWVPVKRTGLARAYMATRQYKNVIGELGGGGIDSAILGLSDALSRIAWVNPNDSIRTIFELPKLLMLGKAYLETGNPEEAKRNFDRMLANPRVRDVGDIHWLALYERGRIAQSEKDLPAAIGFWKRAIEIVEAQRSTLNTEANKIGFAGDKQAVYQSLIQALVSSSLVAEAFDYLERSKSRALVDILARQDRFATASLDTEKVEVLLARSARSEADANSLYVAANGPSPSERRNLAVAATRQSITSASPELASLVTVGSAPLAEIQSLFAADEALVEYYYAGTTLYAFVLTKDKLDVQVSDSSGLEADIHELRKQVEHPQTDAYLPFAQRLARRLTPAMEATGKEKIIVVAHGLLHYLPFSALHDGKAFLGDRFSMRFLPSASVLKYLRRDKMTKPAGILAFGNPDLGDRKMDLNFAEQEALAVVKTVPRSKALVRKEATEAALREYAESFQFLHFATHGQFDAQEPLKSALLLSGEGPSTGLLTVGKLYSMRLNVDLVALSACETGLGKVANGDDVIGLTRGFLFAGAASVVATLWQVDDQATSILMTGFYENLSRVDKREALREAQREVRRTYPHPFFWAAFQLTGNAN